MISNYRFASIDALRGIAALFVFWQHTSESFIRMPGVAVKGDFLFTISNSVDFGRIGVVCFFLISGFVIPFSLKDTGPGSIRRFSIRRFFRLFPAYWLSILAMVIIGPFWGASFHTGVIIANTTMLQSFFGQPHMIGLFWTLQVELIFYFICLILFSFGVLKNEMAIFIVIILCFLLFIAIHGVCRLTGILSGINKELLYIPYLVSIMFIGSLYRKLYDGKQLGKKLIIVTVLSTFLLFGSSLFVIIVSFIGIDLNSRPVQFGISHCLGFVLFFAGLQVKKSVPKPFLWLGAISYSVYLFHPIIMNVMIKFVEVAGIERLNGLHVSKYMGSAFILTILLASLIYFFIERPAIQIGYRFSKMGK